MQLSKLSALMMVATMAIGSVVAQDAAPAAPKAPATTTAKKTTGTTAAKKSTTATAAAPLTTQKQKQSYAVGISLGEILKSRDVQATDVDMVVLTRALRDALAGKKPALTEDQFKEVMTAFTGELTKRRTQKEQAEATKNKADGDAYLAANKSKPGVTVLSSGLQYKVLTPGNGPKPTATDKVVCNYKGTFVDGKEFDSSYKRGEPATFPVSGVIKGWTEALQLMPVGSKWQLVIPPSLAYGEQGRPGMPGNSTLVFEVELIKIAEKEKTAVPATPEPQGAPDDKAKAPGTQTKPQSTPDNSTMAPDSQAKPQ